MFENININLILQGMEMWLEADAEYAKYLQLDIAELAEKRSHLEKHVHQHALASGEHEHRIKTLQREITTNAADLNRLLPKKKALVSLRFLYP